MKLITSITFCLSSLTTVLAQTTIKGSVSDGIDPLALATIFIEESSTGCLTNNQGIFTIDANQGDTLIISYVGYKTQYIQVTEEKELKIELQNESLDEVVITGYGAYYQKDYPICLGTPESESRSAQNIERNSNIDTTIAIYPNPSSTGYFNIPLSESYEKVDISIISIIGQVILTKSYQRPDQNISIDLSRVATGIYIVNTMANGKRLVPQKIIRS